MDFQEAVKTCLRKYATFGGRARRSEFWLFVLFQILVTTAAFIVDRAAGVLILYPLAGLGLFVPGLAVTVRRLHDTGRSAWWVVASYGLMFLAVLSAAAGNPIFSVVMIVGSAIVSIIMFVFLLLPSSPTGNRYGETLPSA